MTAPTELEVQRITCARCEVRYRPACTDGECPICREAAPGHAGREAADEGMDLRAMIVVGMSAVNLLFLGTLAMLFLR